MKYNLLLTIIFLLVEIPTASWQKIGSPYPAQKTNTHITKIHICDNGVIIVGTYYDGVYSSVDNGLTWTEIANGLPINLNDESIVTIDSIILIGGWPDKVYRSKDYGKSWTTLSQTPYFRSFTLQNKIIFAGDDEGLLYKSTDLGLSWDQLSTNLPKGEPIYDMVNQGNRFFADLGTWGVYMSTGDISTWEKPTNLVFDSSVNQSRLSKVSSSDNGGHRLAANNGSILSVRSGAIFSIDNGTTWHVENDGFFSGDPTFRCVAILGDVFITGTSHHGLYILEKGAQSWKSVGTGQLPVGIIALAVNDSQVFAGTGSGIYISNDTCRTWSSSNSGYPNIAVTSIAFQENSIIVSTELGEIFVSEDDGVNWNPVYNELPYISQVAATESHMFALKAGSYNQISGKVFRSDNKGLQWVLSDEGVTTPSNIVTCGTSLFVTNEPTSMTLPYTPIFYSSDNGSTWQPPGSIPQNGVHSLTANGSSLYVGGGGGGISITSDNGQNWKYYNINEYVWVQSIALHQNGIYASGKLGVDYPIYRTLDNGVTWEVYNNGFPENTQTNQLLTYRQSLFAGTSKGIFISSPDNSIWNDFNSGLPSDLNIIKLELNGNYLYAATNKQGLWKINVEEILVAERKITSQKMKISQFEKNLHMSFYLERAGNISIDLYDANGICIQRIINRKFSPGNNQILKPVNHLTRGTYFIYYRSEYDTFSQAFSLF